MPKANEVLNRQKVRIEKEIKEAPKNFDFILKWIPEQITRRTRTGKGVSEDGGKTTKLKAIKLSTQENRLRLKRKGNLSSVTTPRRSNATATGQMLDSIKGKRSGSKFIFEFSGSRKEGESNQKVAEYYGKDRPFFFLAKFEIKLLMDEITKRIDDRIKKLFNNP